MKNNPPTSSFSLDLSGVKPGETITVGRDEHCDIVLPDPDVSSEHLKIVVKEDGVFIRDMQSRHGVMVNHKTFSGLRRLNRNDVVSLPKHDFVIRLPENPCFCGCRLSLDRVSVQFGEKEILKNISMTVMPGEFVGVVGPSGCGKSTLIKVLTGAISATSGSVKLNGKAADNDTLRHRTGYLPQSVIVHDRLTPAESIDDARRLFASGIEADVDTLLEVVGLSGTAGRQLNATLSGGQQKRAGLAQELLFMPELLCLDEVTSGLDPQSERDLMLLFRGLSNQGKTLLCITHYPERLVLCDKLVVLMQGRLVFFGTPAETMKHFGIDSLENLYSRLNAYDSEFWLERYRPVPEDPVSSDDAGGVAVGRHGAWRQFPAFAARYFRIMFRSRAELIFNLLQGVLIGLLIGFCFGGRPDDAGAGELLSRDTKLVFSLVLAAIWTGTTASIREIVKERVLLGHEGRRGISSVSCFMAKMSVLLLPALICILIVGAIVKAWTGIQAGGVEIFGLLALTSAASVALGLLLSAWCSTQEKALSILPVVIIGLIMFSGGIQELKGSGAALARGGCYAYWAYEAARNTLDSEPVSAYEKPVVSGMHNKREKTPLCLWMLIGHCCIFVAGGVYGLRRITR